MPQIHLGTRQAKYAYICTYIRGGRGQGVAALFLTHDMCSVNTLTFSTFLPLRPLLFLMTTPFFPNLCPPCFLWHHLRLSALSLRFFPRRGTEKDLLGEVYWGVYKMLSCSSLFNPLDPTYLPPPAVNCNSSSTFPENRSEELSTVAASSTSPHLPSSPTEPSQSLFCGNCQAIVTVLGGATFSGHLCPLCN